MDNASRNKFCKKAKGNHPKFVTSYCFETAFLLDI